MAETLECPKCGAPLNVNTATLQQSDAGTMPCPYCGAPVILPESLRKASEASEPHEPIVIDLQQTFRPVEISLESYQPAIESIEKTARFSFWGCSLGAVALTLGVGLMGFFLMGGLKGSLAQSAANLFMNPTTVALTRSAPLVKTAIGQAVTPRPTRTPLPPTAYVSPTPTLDRTATAEVIQAATRSAQEDLLAEQQAWPVLLQEKFTANTRNWDVGSYNDNLAVEDLTISKGKYTWQVTSKKSMATFSYPTMAVQKDMYVTVDLQMTESSGNSADQVGIIFRRSPEDHSFYFFGVHPSGTYSLTLYNGNNWIDLLPVAETDLLKPDEVNHLAVSVQGSQILMLINDQVVASLDDEHFSEGDAGLGFNLASPGEDSTVVFSNFTIRAPKKK